MRVSTAGAGLLGALALAACGQSHSSNDHSVAYTVPTSQGAVTIGNTLPTNLPPYVKVYPGATLTATTTTPGGGVIAMDSSAKLDDVVAFYKQDAQGAGLTAQMDSATMDGGAPSHMLLFGSTPSAQGGSQGSQRSLTVTVSLDQSSGRTKIALIYGGG